MIVSEDVLIHYGTPHEGVVPHSGRYEWGSGEDGFQGESDTYTRPHGIYDDIKDLKKKGIITEKEIAKALGYESTKDFREQKAIDNANLKAAEIRFATRMHDKQYSNMEIARRMGKNESYVRTLLDPAKQENAMILHNTISALKDMADKHPNGVDVGLGVERNIGVSQTKKNQALRALTYPKETAPYKITYITQRQIGTGENTTMFILTPKNTDYKTIRENLDSLYIPNTPQTSNGGRKFSDLHEPVSVDLDRVAVRFGKDGGINKDGIIELRRGVKDLDLQNAHYAQVRILVDKNKYLKGMAVYSDDLPKGKDILVNSHYDTMEEALKDIKKSTNKEDPTAILGSYISRQNDTKDAEGNILVKGALNIINEEGGDHDWEKYNKNLASQFLSKQKPELAQKQLNLALSDKKDQLDTIKKLTNPVIRKYYLDDFAEECESDRVSLKAAALPRQCTSVILPLTTLKDNEIYAPKYKQGEELALVRYPHGGIFEIPLLKVNNKNQEGKKLLGNEVTSAVGIGLKAAHKLSGADFDGDTVIVIPTKGLSLKANKVLKELEDFDPQKEYKYHEGVQVISAKEKQKQMGIVTNLISDMTLKGANDNEIVRAVKHSMVVIDAEKHKLDYRDSYSKNAIKALKDKYQYNGEGKKGIKNGASTLISRASSEIPAFEKDPNIKINKQTGEIEEKFRMIKKQKIDPETGKRYVVKDKDGKSIKEPSNIAIRETLKMIPEKIKNPKTGKMEETGKKIPLIKDGKYVIQESKYTKKSTRMAEAKDAYDLSSGTRMENIYAEYANRLRDLANTARKESANTKNMVYSPSANKIYKNEVQSLYSKLVIAEKNKPLERKAQALAGKIYKQKEDELGFIEKSDEKKIRNISLMIARNKIGAKKQLVEMTPKEWEAVQAGAIHGTTLKRILNNSNKDKLRDYAMPKNIGVIMTPSKVSRARNLLNQGYTIAEVAEHMGVSQSTIKNSMKNI